jgi:hypothetical protein
MIVNDPTVLAEVTEAVDAYERALMDNDLKALDSFFWNSPLTVRYGVAENLHGFEAIVAFRVGRTGGSPKRERLRTEIVAFGADLAVTNVEFRREGASGALGRQSQTWIRRPEGWKVCSAHVSLLATGADQRLPPPVS